MREFTVERLTNLLVDAPRNTFWRHDVDVSCAAAAQMARLEALVGIQATFYVMKKSPFYGADETLRLTAELRELGHRVGLHVTVPFGPEALTAASVEMPLSVHCPPDELLWVDIPGVDYAYAAEWKGRYLADSRGVFAHGDPEDLFDGDPWQINLHAEHWFEPDYITRREIDAELYEWFFHEAIPVVAACA